MNKMHFEKLLSLSAPDEKPLQSSFPSRDAILSFYWNSHPRFVFFKTVTRCAKLLDIGAGDGGIVFWKGWNIPVRSDISLHVNDLSKGAYFDKCDQSFICDLSTTLLGDEEGTYNAIMASHVLEHVSNWPLFFERLCALLAPDGLLYIELPTPESLLFPSRHYFADFGIPVSTTNFHDDATHLKTFPIQDIALQLQKMGLDIQSSGLIKNAFLGEELMIWGRSLHDSELCTYGIWLYSGFSQYLVACKPLKENS